MQGKKINTNNKKKRLGQVYTPNWVIDTILEELQFSKKNIHNFKILEPGSGSGNFLVPIIEAVIKSALNSSLEKNQIKEILESNIYGIEIDKTAYKQSIKRVNELAIKYNLTDIKWNILNIDILDLDLEKLPMFDIIVGNPPYIRVHNIEKDKIKNIKERFEFCKKGIIDMFLVFFEIGINKLKDNGVLGFITPNSYFYNSTYKNFRKYLSDKNLIDKIIDFKNNTVFKDASTYNAITIIRKSKDNELISYYEYNFNTVKLINNFSLNSLNEERWNLSSNEDFEFLEKISKRDNKVEDLVNIQYGFATLLDEAYIIKDSDLIKKFNNEKQIFYKVVKGSRYDGSKIYDGIIFPYLLHENKIKNISEDYFRANFPLIYSHLHNYKDKLTKRSMDVSAKNWYEYGRSQGIKSIHVKKLVINPVFKDRIKIYELDSDVMVYSGIFLFLKDNSKYTLNQIKDYLESDEFRKYATLNSKDMSGGYKNLNTKIIKQYGLP